MIPKRLCLKNFLSYGEKPCELNFDQFHVACIVGKNGAGKSSLLESIAWCIWGESPRGKNKEVIRQGARQAQVEFEFEQNEQLYRIVRTARHSKRNVTQRVDFFYWDAESERFKPLSDKKITETEKRISKVVGMSYDTFINSVFLLQGRSNEFTVQDAARRKEILAEILQIGRYAEIAECAKERRRQLEQKDTQLKLYLELLGRELEEEPKINQDLAAAQARLSELVQQKEKLDDELAQCEKELEALKQKEIDLATESAHLRNIETRAKECQKQIEEQEREKSILTEKLSKREQVEQDVKEYERLKAELDALESVAEQYHRLRERLHNTQSQIQLARQKLEQEIKIEQQRFEALKKEEARYQNEINRKHEAQVELAQLREKLNTLQEMIADLPKLRRDAEELAKESGTIAAKVQSCKQQMSEIEKKGKAFKELKETNCPVCHSELTPERRE
ncbi:MAG: AAA family ATPase, partial [Candidatus Thermochlorobacter sp.]